VNNKFPKTRVGFEIPCMTQLCIYAYHFDAILNGYIGLCLNVIYVFHWKSQQRQKREKVIALIPDLCVSVATYFVCVVNPFVQFQLVPLSLA